MQYRKKSGFTIVELVVVIGILAVLVGLTVVTYGSWRERTATTEIKSDLSNAVLAMNNERNFNNVYPNELPASYKSSAEVVVERKSGDGNSFCLQGTSKVIPSLVYFVNSTTQKQPIKGTCSGGPGAVPLSPGYMAISAGNLHTCAIALGDNNAYCWGLNNAGQLGSGTTDAISTSPSAVSTSGVLSGKTVKAIASGALHTCALASDNNVYCWGSNDKGRLGNNSTSDSSVPVAVSTSGALSGKTITSLSVNGGGHSCAIASDNNAYCWGINSSGELGNNNAPTESLVPVAVSTSGALSGKTVKSISAGYSHTCAIASDNNAYCWGYNLFGQVGNNATSNSPVPVAVSNSGVLSGKTISKITAGIYTTCAIASDNKPYCWGYGGYGGLGNNSTSNSSTPVAVSTTGVLNGKSLTQISNAHHQCAIASDNNAYCWGNNTHGQVGDGTSGTHRQVPIKVLDP